MIELMQNWKFIERKSCRRAALKAGLDFVDERKRSVATEFAVHVIKRSVPEHGACEAVLFDPVAALRDRVLILVSNPLLKFNLNIIEKSVC